MSEKPSTDETDTAGDRPTVLVVDDEERVCQAFELWLGEEYRVLTATDGERALEALEPAVAVVLLDRHMPGLSGDEVLERIRASDQCDPQVAMVTAVDPDFDIVEMPFDDYLSKPVDRTQLRDAVDRLLAVGTYEESITDLYALDRTIATLESEMTPPELDNSDEYQRALGRRDSIQAELQETIATMDGDDIDRLFERLD